jgi:hypothetical protein
LRIGLCAINNILDKLLYSPIERAKIKPVMLFAAVAPIETELLFYLSVFCFFVTLLCTVDLKAGHVQTKPTKTLAPNKKIRKRPRLRGTLFYVDKNSRNCLRRQFANSHRSDACI